MKLEKMRTYLNVLKIITDLARFSSKLMRYYLQQRGSTIAYYTLNKMLKAYAEEGYIERFEVPTTQLRMGGPKYTYMIAEMGKDFLRTLEEQFRKEATNQPKINPKEFTENISSELIEILQDQEVSKDIQYILLKKFRVISE